MKSKILSLILCAFFIPQVFAAAVEPKACPSIEAIKSAGVNMAEDSHIIGWVAVNQKNKFDTDQEWSFGIMGIPAQNEEEALSKANEALGFLVLQAGPDKDKEGKDQWGCIYASPEENGGNLAVAVTPPLASSNSMHFLNLRR